MPNEAGTGADFPTGLDVLVSAVESRLARLEAVVEDLRKEFVAIRMDLAEMKGRLANIPTTFQLFYMQAGLILAIFAAAFGLLKLAAPH